MNRTSAFYKDLALELVNGNKQALSDMLDEKKRRAQEAVKLLQTQINDAKAYAYGMRKGDSWKSGINEKASLEDVLTLAHSKNQLLSGPGTKVTSAKGMLDEAPLSAVLIVAWKWREGPREGPRKGGGFVSLHATNNNLRLTFCFRFCSVLGIERKRDWTALLLSCSKLQAGPGSIPFQQS